MHGGEVQDVKDTFEALKDEEQGEEIEFLSRLRTPTKPNEDLIEGLDPDATSPTSGHEVLNYVRENRWTPPVTEDFI